jgi:hypothetical protein
MDQLGVGSSYLVRRRADGHGMRPWPEKAAVGVGGVLVIAVLGGATAGGLLVS